MIAINIKNKCLVSVSAAMSKQPDLGYAGHAGILLLGIVVVWESKLADGLMSNIRSQDHRLVFNFIVG
jgi:hypothetical protein